MLYLSQSHLEIFTHCPPTFQRKYLDQLTTPIPPDQQQKVDFGLNFHLAMQQLHLGFSLAQVTHNQDLQRAIAGLLEQLPEFLNSPTQILSETEYRQTLKHHDILLTIICDWLLVTKKSIKIFDWKTYRQPQDPQILKQHWQTKLYLYVITETSGYQPDAVSMTYWFVTTETAPQSLTFHYNHTWHREIKTELDTLLGSLKQHVQGYLEEGLSLQHPGQKTCGMCVQQTEPRRSPTLWEQMENLETFLATIPVIEM